MAGNPNRGAATVGDLIDRFIEEHLPKLEATNARDQKSMLQQAGHAGLAHCARSRRSRRTTSIGC